MTRTAKLRSAAAALLAATCAVACNPTPSTGSFTASDLIYGNCEEEVVPWQPEFYTIDQFENDLTIRLQSEAGGIGTLDGIFIQLDRRYALDHVELPILLGLPDSANGRLRARALLGFYETCPTANVVPELIGTITFTFFEPENDGQISGRVDAPVVVDSRSGNIIGVDFEGYFSFRVQKGRPYTNFTGPGQE